MEVLSGLALGLKRLNEQPLLRNALEQAERSLVVQLADIELLEEDLPPWLSHLFGTAEGAWLAAAITGFYDE